MHGTATFDTASVGTGKTVTVSGLTLSGAAAGNYAGDTRDDDGGDRTAVRYAGVTVATKATTGTPSATLTSCTLATSRRMS